MATVELDGRGRPVVKADEEGDDIDGNNVDLNRVQFAPIPAQQSVRQKASIVDTIVREHAARVADAPLSASKLTRDIRARLKVVRREIALRKRLEREEEQLLRLLKAAKEKPTQVRAIRAAG